MKSAFPSTLKDTEIRSESETGRGLWFGSRGCIGKSVINFFKDFKLNCDKLKDISEMILVKTISIINNHIYK